MSPHERLAEVEDTWRSLQAIAPHSFFTSWSWIGTWLAHLPSTAEVRFLTLFDGEEPLCCLLLGVATQVDGWFFRKKKGYLNATGIPDLDSLMIEYNGPLLRPGAAVAGTVFNDPNVADIDEFVLPGITSNRDLEPFVDDAGLSRVVAERPCYYVDLDKVRDGRTDFLQLISRNSRAQVRRSIREYEKAGELELRAAASVQEALRMLEGLAELHQKEWVARGESGAFASRFFRGFHEALIEHCFGRGEVQLLEVSAGREIVGYLYNFIYQDRVLFYQSGFNYRDGKNFRPGLVSHYLAIEHSLAEGRRAYDFLAGEARYKRSLSTDCEPMYWQAVTRKTPKGRFEQFLRRIKKSF